MVDLRQGDCLQVMKELPDNSIDMILCDLPYGTTRNKNDKRLDFVALWKEYKRIIKDNGCIALFGQGLFYVDLVNSNRKWFRYEWVWDKVLTSGFLNAKECRSDGTSRSPFFTNARPSTYRNSRRASRYTAREHAIKASR